MKKKAQQAEQARKGGGEMADKKFMLISAEGYFGTAEYLSLKPGDAVEGEVLAHMEADHSDWISADPPVSRPPAPKPGTDAAKIPIQTEPQDEGKGMI